MKPPKKRNETPREGSVSEEVDVPPLFHEDPEIARDLKDLLPQLEVFDSVRPSRRIGTVVRARALRRERRKDRALGAWTFLWNLELALKRSIPLRLGLGLVFLLGAFLFFLGLFSQNPVSNPELWKEAGALRAKVSGNPLKGLGTEALPKKPLDSLAWIHSNNDLRMLRFLLRRRSGGEFSLRAAKQVGFDARSRQRVEFLGKTLVGFLEKRGMGRDDLNPSYEEVERDSLALKALLASGSTTRRGPHAAWVRKLLGRIEVWLPRLHGESLAVALGAYLEGALITNGQRVDVLSRELCRFTQEQAEGLRAYRHKQRGKGGTQRALGFLGTWASSVNSLAEAGLLLRLAPALSVSPEKASRLRQVFLQHLLLRTHSRGSQGIHARAALLFGYGDLVDPEPIRKGLIFFERNPQWLGTRNPTLYHLAWSLFPPKRGWARFEAALRRLIAGANPSNLRETAILLLAQTVYLAPYLGGR